MKKILPALASIYLLSGCGQSTSYNYPKSSYEIRRDRVGSLATGDHESGISLWGGKKQKSSHAKEASVMNVNPYLWQAALEVVNFMPLQSNDSTGGVIITGWYEDQAALGERFKLNIFITSQELHVKSLKVKVFKQKLDSHHLWRDAAVNKNLNTEFEDKILNKARELYISAQQ